MSLRAYRYLILSLTIALALAGGIGLRAQDELRQRQKEIAESELRYLAEKAKTEGKTTITFKRGFHRDLIPWSPQNRLASATVLVATATGTSETLFYQPPPTFWTLLSFAVEEEIAGKVPTGDCRHVESLSQPANHVWIPIAGGSRNVSGITISHDAGWPIRPVAGRRYLLIGERCSMEMMQLTLGPEDLYEVSPGDAIQPNPSESEYVRYVNGLGTLSSVRQLLRTSK